MQHIVLPERKRISRLIRTSVCQNPRMQFLFGKRLHGLRFNLLIRQCTRYIRKKNGAVISSDGQGLAVILPISSERDQQRPFQWWTSLFLIPLKRIGAVSRFRRRQKAFMPMEPHLFLMLLVVEEQRNGMSTILELRDELFRLSAIMQLPVYAQTASERTKRLFEGFGFTAYGRVPIPKKDEYIYFLKKQP